MFEREITICQFLLKSLDQIVCDIPENKIYERAPGNGHPPVWILGHIAICGELGEKFSGGDITHPEWLPVFGPGSSDEIADSGQYSKSELVEAIHSSYGRFCELAANPDEQNMSGPHGVELLDGTLIQNVGQLITHLLSSHLGFHLAQLSAWRRAAGHSALF